MDSLQNKRFILPIIVITALAIASFFFVERDETQQQYVFIASDKIDFELPSFKPEVDTLEVKEVIHENPHTEESVKIETSLSDLEPKTTKKEIKFEKLTFETPAETPSREDLIAMLQKEVEDYVNDGIEASLQRYPFTYSQISEIYCHHKNCKITVDNALFVEEKVENNATIKVKTFKLKIARNCSIQKRQSYDSLPDEELLGEFPVRYRCVMPV